MPKAKNNVASRKRKRKVLKLSKGYWGDRGNVFTVAKNAVEKGLVHAYRDRKTKKRIYRQLWIARINAAVRPHGLNYSKFIHSLDNKGVVINRKVLANLAVDNPNAFSELVKFAAN